jgi:hypothetical protein
MRASADLDKGTAFLEPVSKVLNEEGSPSIYWSSQDSVETLSARLVSRFELRWTHPAEMTVAPHSIVEGIDVVGHIGDRQLSALVDLFLDPLFLQAAEEGLGDGLSQQLPFRLILGSRRLRRRNRSTRMRHRAHEFSVAFAPPVTGSTGSVNVNVDPCPISLFTQIWPPWSSTNFRQSANPRPVPSAFFSALPT